MLACREEVHVTAIDLHLVLLSLYGTACRRGCYPDTTFLQQLSLQFFHCFLVQ